MLPDEQASPKQLEIMRAMTSEQRLILAGKLYWTARTIKLAGLRAQHPDWSQEQLEAETRRLFLNART